MEVCSLEFLFAVLVLGALFPLIRSLFWKRAVLGGLNLACLALLLTSWTSLALLAAILLSGYAVGKALRKRPSRTLLVTYLVLFIALFAYLKKYSFLALVFPRGVLAHHLAIAGLSYMFFRQIHFLVDQHQGSDDPMDLWGYLNYQLNIFSFLSGPITRYPEFREDWAELRPLWADRYDLLKSYARIWIGVIKIMLLSNFFSIYYNRALAVCSSGAAHGHLGLYFLMMFYAFPIYIYFNFSGYCDIVIGCGSLFGLKIPENFDRPYLSRNMIEFWSRWHISLGAWIKDYLYTPMMRGVLTRMPNKGMNLAFLCYFVAFFIAGVWHGSSWNFVLYGLLQGLGVSLAKLWEVFLTGRLGSAGFRKYLASGPVRVLAILVTIHYFCFTCLIFGLELPALLKLLHRLVPA